MQKKCLHKYVGNTFHIGIYSHCYKTIVKAKSTKSDKLDYSLCTVIQTCKMKNDDVQILKKGFTNSDSFIRRASLETSRI